MEQAKAVDDTRTIDISKVEKREKAKEFFGRLIPLFGLIFIVILFEILSDGKLLSPRNLSSLFDQVFAVLICTTAGVYIMATGNLDFSIGANMGVCAVFGCFAAFVNPLLALPVAIVSGIVIGFFVGAIQVYFKLPSFVTCLCMMFVLVALSQSLTGGASKMVPAEMLAWDLGALKWVVLVVYMAAMYIVFDFTRVGKQLKAMGISNEASTQSGVKIGKMRIIAYMITGLAAGIAGYFTLLRSGSASYTIGQTTTVDVIIAVVLGGMAISGGETSRISAAVYGSLISVVLDSGIVLAGFGGDAQQLVKGLLFIVVMAISIGKNKNVLVQ